MDVFFEESRGTIRNLPQIQQSLRANQTKEDLQGYPSMLSFWPRHWKLEMDEDTRENAKTLLDYTLVGWPNIKLEDILADIEFQVLPAPSDKLVKFDFHIPMLNPIATRALFANLMDKTDTLELTPAQLFEICEEFAKTIVTAPNSGITPLLLYRTIQERKQDFLA